MLTKLALKDFQILKSLSLDLRRVTVIVGRTGSGKSAIVRALRSVLTAKAGSGMVRHGATESKVVLEVDGHLIGWAKGKAKNVYLLDSKRYEKVGLDVPEDVATLLNVAEVGVGGVKTRLLNIQTQHDPPFLLTESGSEVGEYLSKLSGLDKLCYIVELVADDVRRTKQTLGTKLQELDVLRSREEKLKALAPSVVLIDEKVSALRKNAEEYAKLEQAALDKMNLSKIEQALVSLSELISTTEAIVKAGDWLIESLGQSIEQDKVVECIKEIDKAILFLTDLTGRSSALLTLMQSMLIDSQDLLAADEVVDMRRSVDVQLADAEDNLRMNLLERQAVAEKMSTEVMKMGQCVVCGNTITQECENEVLKFVKLKCGL